MIYKEAYQYITGEMVFTYDGKQWFAFNPQTNDSENLDGLDKSKIAFKIK